MTMTTLTLTEYETRIGVPLTHDQCSALRAVTPSITVSPTVGAFGCFDLTPSSTIGAINIGTLSIEIRPKLPIDRVLFLISYSLNPRNWRKTGFDFAEQRSLVEAIIPGFVAQVRRAFAQGVLQGYQTIEDSLMTVRGRIRFDDQIRKRYGILPPIEVRFDEFTTDIDENRLIKAAISRLGQLQIRSAASKRSLRAFDNLLPDVRQVEYDRRQLPVINYSRLNEHYRSAVELAKLILQGSSFELHHGFVSASCFLLDMNKVFEDFVIVALRETLKLSSRDFPQNAKGRNLHLDEAQAVGLQPDISWWDGTNCSFVGDVKYKRVIAEGVKHPDLYQVLAYAVAADLPGSLLIYAAGEVEAVTHVVRFIGKKIEVVALELAGAPDEILSQVFRVGLRIRRLRKIALADLNIAVKIPVSERRSRPNLTRPRG